MNIPRHSLIAAVAFGALVAPGAYSPIAAQANSQSLGVSAVFQGYDFDNALGIDAAQLVMIPVAYRLPAGERFSAELSSAWAEGRVQRDGQVSVLKGLVDTRLHFSYKASPWAILYGERELAHRQRHSQLGRGRGGVRAVLRHPGLPGIELGHGWLSDHGLGHGPSSRQLGLGPRPELPGGGRVRTDDRHHPGLLTRKRAARKGRCRPERG